METYRLFLALPLPPPLILHLEEAMKGIDSRGLDAVWTKPEAMHLTLHFLGDTPPNLLEDLRHDLGACFHRHRPFDLEARGLGCFPAPERPRVLWAGVLDPHRRLQALVDDSRRVLNRYRLFKLDEQPYVPHLTLARVRGQLPSFDPGPFARALKAWSRGAVLPVERGVLYRSHLAKEGARHERLQEYPLNPQP